MNDIPDWVLKEAAKRCDWHPSKTLAQMRGYLSSSASFTALCRAIEQHEAFRQEVSDELIKQGFINASTGIGRFIIPAPKPDPLVKVLNEISHEGGFDNFNHYAHRLRAALDAAGFEIREKNDDN